MQEIKNVKQESSAQAIAEKEFEIVTSRRIEEQCRPTVWFTKQNISMKKWDEVMTNCNALKVRMNKIPKLI